MNVVCTIITGNYGGYALALHDSILKFNKNQHFAVFVSKDVLNSNILNIIKSRANFSVYEFSDLNSTELALQLKDKYCESYHDAYRWGMKPIFINFLLNKYDHVIYVDSDIFFFNDYSFLFEELKKSSVLLSPHWRCSNPKIDLQNFKLNFLDGIYNGGFVGASKEGISAMNYWAELCLFNCEVNRGQGFFVDQKYLDILASRFRNVNNIRHKGCNVANWNQVDCKRILHQENEVVINNKYPIIFIHFTTSFLRGVLLGSDKVLMPYLEKYRDTLFKYTGNDIIKIFFNKEEDLKKKRLSKKHFSIKGFVKKVKRKMLNW